MGMAMLLGMATLFGGCGTVSLLSTDQEIAMGNEFAPQFLEQGGGGIPDPQIQQYVEGIGMRLVEQIKPEHQRGLPWEFHVLDTSMMNAFALPGGKVFITRNLLSKMNSEAELAGVLAHEIGHVVAEHIGKQMTDRAVWQLGLGLATEATDSQWLGVLGGYAGNLYMLRFSRTQEYEADEIGMTYMERLGYDPRGMVNVLEMLASQEGAGQGIEMFSTHPDPGNRLERARQRIDEEFALSGAGRRYIVGREEYRQAVLSRLDDLPPPQHDPQAQQTAQ
jgi:predicted Zn-dependent protease